MIDTVMDTGRRDTHTMLIEAVMVYPIVVPNIFRYCTILHRKTLFPPNHV
jgi:hypothetical protein